MSLQEARDHITQRCFGQPTSGTVGIELELFPVLVSLGWSAPPPLARVQELLGGVDLPCGSAVTFEPGGQVELSTRTFARVDDACRALAADLDAARAAVAVAGIELLATGSDPVRRPERV